MSSGLLKTDRRLNGNLAKIRYIIGVAAGKGGVGKSSVTVNLALSLQKLGYAVGVLDADLYGPSIGQMMPLTEDIKISEKEIFPGSFREVKTFSLAYLRRSDAALIARAPVVNGLIIQAIEQVQWGDLDYLLVDFPPGTGDIQLTLMQTLSFAGAVLVTTPQIVSTLDVEKALQMFHQMQVPILGVLENMSYFEDDCGKKHFVFGEGGGKKIANSFGMPFLGNVPIDGEVSKCGDLGLSLVHEMPESKAAQSFANIALQIRDFLFAFESEDGEYLGFFEYTWKEME